MTSNAVDVCPWDPNSFSRPDELIVTNIHLEWVVDFDGRRLSGASYLDVKRIQTGVDKLYLDTRDLEISSVFQIVEPPGTDISLSFTLGDAHPVYGSKLEIQLPTATDVESSVQYRLKVSYRTSPKSSALQWLRPKQTAGKKHPYLFSQCEAIHARSMLPCQDTPSVKATYTAKVIAPKGMTVLMSALRLNDPAVINDNGDTQFTFKQTNPIPSYLIAVVVGALDSRYVKLWLTNRQISDRIDVWSEKEIVDKAAYEFAEAETMLKTAEQIAGPYLWERYDILVLPPSFPFGGMENPCLTFVTPTLLAGDRSQANVVAHEIAHSWTGNLVTNKNFEHFWLNEGFTVFLERKIGGRMFGEKYRQFVSICGWKELKDAVNTLGEANPLTRLVVDLNGVDPDDAFSTVPYEKGYAFLYFLENKFGGPSAFEPFLRSYIEIHKFKSIDTATFKEYLMKYFKIGETDVNWNSWLYQPGMPPETNAYDTSVEDVCRNLSERWLQANKTDSFSEDDLADMSPIEIQEFLTLLLENNSFSIDKLQSMEKTYKFNSALNSEVRLRWLRLCLENHWIPAIALAIRFVNEQGRMKYLKPIYRALYLWREARPLAIANFELHRDKMMYLTEHCVAKELHLD